MTINLEARNAIEALVRMIMYLSSCCTDIVFLFSEVGEVPSHFRGDIKTCARKYCLSLYGISPAQDHLGKDAPGDPEIAQLVAELQDPNMDIPFILGDPNENFVYHNSNSSKPILTISSGCDTVLTSRFKDFNHEVLLWETECDRKHL